ncbi:MAG: B12-binding domain-containing radical SAM protein [Magnetococcales bacterium]|nr:B12-binding domain-containing radical SAM protein [Magnetococcales bacterium]
MKTLLVMPRFVEDNHNSYDMAVGILYISAALKQAGKQVHCLNLNHEEGPIEQVIAHHIDALDVDICATGGISAHAKTIQTILQAAKQSKPNIINIVGGGVVSADPLTAASLMTLDIGVIGEGEQAIVEIVQALEDGTPLQAVTGLVLKPTDAPPMRTPERPINREISTLPWPDFDGFQMARLLERQIPQSNYIHFAEDDPRAIPIIASRSCPLSCTFCYHPNGKVYRERDLDDFFQELDHLIETYKINIIMVLDELLAFKKSRLIEFCQRMKAYGLPWLCQLHVKVVDKTTLQVLKEAGCVYISLGIEHMSAPVLASMKKKITPEQLQRALALIYEAGIGIQGNFLIGDPAENLDTLAETFDFWAHHPEYCINFSALDILPGSELFQLGVQNGRITDPAAAYADPTIPINLSTLDDALFYPLRERILFYSQTLPYPATVEGFMMDEVPHPILGQGLTYQWRCPKCQGGNLYKNLYNSVWSIRLTCRHCRARSDVPMWHPPMNPHPQADLQLAAAERLDELFSLTKNPQAREAARQHYSQLIEQHCGPAMESWACIRAFHRFGALELQVGERSNAMFFLMHALRTNIWNPHCHAEFAKALEMEGSLGAALLYFKKAVQLSDDPPQSWPNRCRELEQAVKAQGADRDLATLYFNPFKQFHQRLERGELAEGETISVCG